jgi:hypothetical protein
MIKDSGERTEFNSGAVRDYKSGVGRCDLLPFEIIYDFYDDTHGLFHALTSLRRCGNISPLYNVIAKFSRAAFGSTETALMEVSIHFEEGAQKYAERNWEKGIPVHSFVSSGIRHYLKYMRGDDDERHDRAFLWNMMCLLWTLKNHPELDDFTQKNE